MSVITDNPRVFSLVKWAENLWALEIHAPGLGGGPLTCGDPAVLETVAGALLPVLRENERCQAVAASAGWRR